MNGTTFEEFVEVASNSNVFNLASLSDLITISPLPLISGTIALYYIKKPKILAKTELANYIHADSNTRIHEYVVTLSHGWGKIPWDKLVNMRPLHILDVLPNTKLEYYYIPRDSAEEKFPNECKLENKKNKEKKIVILNLKTLKDLKIECFYVKTSDKEQSKFTNKISLDYYPDSIRPIKIEVRNGNKIPIRYFEFELTADQTQYLKSKIENFPKSIKWSNTEIDDCFISNQKLKISIKEVPKSSIELSGSITLNLT